MARLSFLLLTLGLLGGMNWSAQTAPPSKLRKTVSTVPRLTSPLSAVKSD